MKKAKLISLLVLSVIIISCGTQPAERNYFVLDYSPVPEDQRLILDRPLPYRVQVPDSRISRVYDRSQVIFRYSAHKIEYSANDLWAVRLSSAIPDLMTKHLTAYNTFSVVQRDFLIERPDFEVITFVNKIELLKSEFYQAVNINMNIFLRHGPDLTYLVRHSFDREHEVYSEDVEIFVQNLSRIIKEETDMFIEKVLYHFEVLQDETEE